MRSTDSKVGGYEGGLRGLQAAYLGILQSVRCRIYKHADKLCNLRGAFSGKPNGLLVVYISHAALENVVLQLHYLHTKYMENAASTKTIGVVSDV